MNQNETYSGIDCFRFWAALLIIAIHTSPLAMFGSTGDFILTRVAARVAVPFFFMTSGFFLISHYAENAEKLMRFVKHTCLIYGLAIALYLPVNVYNGYFQIDELAPNLVKDLVFDGTVYHLWYLPASVIGALIAWYLVRRFDYQKAMLISFGLYVDEEGTMVAGAANTKSHLFDPICRELSIHSRVLGTENKVKRFRDKLIQLCVEILAELKAEGVLCQRVPFADFA